jgi:hypothetical protein
MIRNMLEWDDAVTAHSGHDFYAPNVSWRSRANASCPPNPLQSSRFSGGDCRTKLKRWTESAVVGPQGHQVLVKYPGVQPF